MKIKFGCWGCKNSGSWNLPTKNKINIRVHEETGSRSLQYASVISVSLMSIGSGASTLWISAALPYLKSSDFEFTITGDQLSWIVSLFSVGQIIGFLLYPFFIDRIGRKYTLLASSLPQLLSWLFICIGQNVIMLYLARLVGGIGYGAGTVVQLIYINEIAEKDIRGRLTSISQLAFLIGCICLLIIGAFSSYKIMNFIMISTPVIFFLTFVLFPESPYFYLKCNRSDDAIKSLSKLRGISDSNVLYLEVNKLKEAIIEDEKCKKFALRNLFEDHRQRKALIIISFIKTGALFSGTSVISTYMQDILSFTEFSLDPKYTIIILSVIVVFFIAPTIVLVDFLGRKIVILCSSIICSLSLFLLGLFFFFKIYFQINIDSSLSWIPLIALVTLDVACTALISVSIILSGELFSSRVRNSGLSFLFITNHLLEFLTKFSFENIVNVFGIFGVFWLYAMACSILSISGFIILPETKGKSLEEIQLLLD